MKKYVLFVAMLWLSPLCLWAQKNGVPKLERVTIFADGAQVNRSLKTSLQAGEQTLTLEGLSPHLDVNSIELKGKGAFTILGVSRRWMKADSAQLAQKQDELLRRYNQAQRSVKVLEIQLEALKSKAELLKNNCSTLNRATQPSVETLKQLNTYYYNELVALNQKELDLTDQLASAHELAEKRKASLDSVQHVRPQRLSALEVKLDVPSATTALFSLSYFVSQARWYPTYEMRATEAQGPLQLTYQAHVEQSTLEDWKNCPVTLSSATPTRSNEAPQLSPYWLSLPKPAPRKLASAKMDMNRRIAGVNLMAQYDNIETEELADSQLPVVVATEAKFGYEFALEHPLTLLSGKPATTTTIGQFELPATYVYECSPKLDKHAFLMTDATGWTDLNLLEGEAKVFYENTYVGKTFLNPAAESDTLHVSLGRDQGIQITRNLQKNNSRRRLLSNSQVQAKDWEIKIKNTRREAVELKVFDQVPVSQDADIEVSVKDCSKGRLDEATGLVSWTLHLQPDETRTLRLCYEVKYPKSKFLYIE